jgi:hypothetical protein
MIGLGFIFSYVIYPIIVIGILLFIYKLVTQSESVTSEKFRNKGHKKDLGHIHPYKILPYPNPSKERKREAELAKMSNNEIDKYKNRIDIEDSSYEIELSDDDENIVENYKEKMKAPKSILKKVKFDNEMKMKMRMKNIEQKEKKKGKGNGKEKEKGNSKKTEHFIREHLVGNSKGTDDSGEDENDDENDDTEEPEPLRVVEKPTPKQQQVKKKMENERKLKEQMELKEREEATDYSGDSDGEDDTTEDGMMTDATETDVELDDESEAKLLEELQQRALERQHRQNTKNKNKQIEGFVPWITKQNKREKKHMNPYIRKSNGPSPYHSNIFDKAYLHP